MIRTALLLACLAAPAAAQDRAMLEHLLRDLDDATDPKALRAATAACILGEGNADAIAAYFTEAGWTRSDDTEMGMTSLSAPAGSVGVSLYDDGRICDVASEGWGTDTALGALQIASGVAGLGLETLPDSECTALRLTPSVTVEVTSTGQDPVCFSENTSALRFTYAAAN